jgi:hypothetical protein
MRPTIHDASGHGHDGHVNRAQWDEGDAGFGGALRFAASGEPTTVPADPDLAGEHGLTVSAAIARQDGIWQTILSKGTAGDADAYALYAADGTGQLLAQIGGTSIHGPALPTDEWARVALTYDGSTAQLYVDGQLAGSAVVATPLAYGADPMVLGSASGVPTRELHGAIDELRVYDRPLNAGDVAIDDARAIASGAVTPTIMLDGPLSDDDVVGFSTAIRATASEVATDGSWTPGSSEC